MRDSSRTLWQLFQGAAEDLYNLLSVDETRGLASRRPDKLVGWTSNGHCISIRLSRAFTSLLTLKVALNAATGRIILASEGNKETTFNDVNSGTIITAMGIRSATICWTSLPKWAALQDSVTTSDPAFTPHFMFL